jgi:hypothetical protein
MTYRKLLAANHLGSINVVGLRGTVNPFLPIFPIDRFALSGDEGIRTPDPGVANAMLSH